MAKSRDQFILGGRDGFGGRRLCVARKDQPVMGGDARHIVAGQVGEEFGLRKVRAHVGRDEMGNDLDVVVLFQHRNCLCRQITVGIIDLVKVMNAMRSAAQKAQPFVCPTAGRRQGSAVEDPPDTRREVACQTPHFCRAGQPRRLAGIAQESAPVSERTWPSRGLDFPPRTLA